MKAHWKLPQGRRRHRPDGLLLRLQMIGMLELGSAPAIMHVPLESVSWRGGMHGQGQSWADSAPCDRGSPCGVSGASCSQEIRFVGHSHLENLNSE